MGSDDLRERGGSGEGQGRSAFGNQHTAACRSTRCPCYVAGQDSLVAALEQRDNDIESGAMYRQAKAEGYAEACRLFGPELEAGREARRRLAAPSSSEGVEPSVCEVCGDGVLRIAGTSDEVASLCRTCWTASSEGVGDG